MGSQLSTSMYYYYYSSHAERIFPRASKITDTERTKTQKETKSEFFLTKYGLEKKTCTVQVQGTEAYQPTSGTPHTIGV